MRRLLAAVSLSWIQCLFALCAIAAPDAEQDILSLAPPLQALDNATTVGPDVYPLRPTATCGIDILASGVEPPLFRIFKRDNMCYFTTGTLTRTCGTNSICCSSGTVPWCCPNTNGCGPSSAAGCTWKITTLVATNFITTTTTTTSNHVVPVPGSTVLSTVVSTTTTVVTKSSLDTATDVTYVTVTAKAKRDARWQLRAHVVAHTTASIAPSTILPSLSSTQGNSAIERPPQITEAPRVELRGMLWRRQTLSTSTVYSTTTAYVYVTKSADATSSSYYVVSSVITSVSIVTITSAVNAKTTVKATSTITQPAQQTVVSVLSASGQNSQGSQGPSTASSQTGTSGPQQNTGGPTVVPEGGGGLSKGAQAGIGAGTGAGSLIICIILGFCLHRRRKNKKKETQEMIQDAVAAATAAAQSPTTKEPIVSNVPMPPKTTYYHTGANSPPPGSERYSDIVPVYHSGTSSPAPQYPPNGRFSTNTPTGFEMSATPAPSAHTQPTYQYPRPSDPIQRDVHTPQSPVEMHHPIPAEVPNVYSPRPNYAMPQEMPGQGPAYPGHVPYDSGPRPYGR